MGYVDEIEQGEFRSEKEQIRALQLSTLARVYEGADRVLTGDPITVQVVKEGHAAAWSDGETIWLNASKIDEMDIETLTNVTGLNYHELAHHFYSPRKGTTIIKWVIDTGFYMAFNLLEDARCETLFIARYPSVMPYLQEIALKHAAATPDTAVTNYPMLYGRRYLPVHIREAFRDMFYKPELIPDIQRIIDEYRLLAFPRDYKRAQQLIEEFQKLVLDELDQEMMNAGHAGCMDRLPLIKGRPEPGKAQERDAKVAANMGTRESVYTPKDPATPQDVTEEQEEWPGGCGFPVGPDDSEESSSIVKGGNGVPISSTTIPQNAEEALELRQQNKERIDQLDPELEDQTSLNAGSGHHKSFGGIPNDLMDDIQDALEDIYSRKDVLRDIRRKQRVIITGREDFDEAEAGVFDSVPVPPVNLLDYKKFSHELQKLRDDSEPHWFRGVSSGKLNVRRFIRNRNAEEAFDRWTEGDDSTDIEAVILIDRSGSMNSDNNDRQASLMCWTIKRALEHIDCPVTVYAFDDKTEIAYTRAQKAERTKYKFIYGNGGTDPYESLLMAEKVLLSSQRKNKMLFMITDGVFNSDKNDDVIKRISKRGILTTMVLIMRDRDYASIEERNQQAINKYGSPEYELQHGAELFKRVNSSKDLLALAKEVVVGAIKKKQRI